MATTASTKRPRGRPPMACEKIKNTTRRKTEPFIQKVVVKKCEAREKKAYAPYSCKLTERNKCVTPNIKMFDNALFSASPKKSKSASVAKKPASPSPLSTASTVKSTKSSVASTGPKKVKTYTVKFYDNPAFSASPKKESVKMRNNPLYSK